MPPLGPSPMVASVASELARICVGLGMGPPDFTVLRNRQGLVLCQVKLSTGLMVHGPQCQSENDAKEKAALFALQRLNSVGSGFPLPPPLFPGIGQIQPPLGHMPPVFNQPGGLMMPPQGYGPLHWGMGMPLPPHQGQPFYGGTFPGARPQAPSLPIGSHNQFVPLQVTKKRVSSGKKNQDSREFYSAAHLAGRNQNQNQNLAQPQPPSPATTPSKTPPPSSQTPPDTATSASRTPSTPRQNPPTPGSGSASKRKHRKLAVNFEAAKVME